MRKLFYLLFLLIFALFSVKTSFALETVQQTSTVKYDLAYPGILPDNPLYKLKTLRDRIEEFFITNPKQKVEFYLLQTDKGVLASAILVDKHEIKLAEETALKAENNYTLLTEHLGDLEDRRDNKLFNKIETAGLKHQEVLALLILRVPDKDKKVFETVLNFSKLNLEKVRQFVKSAKE